ncbi:MAG: chitobiase/beta-hexosaminidase C-terminal domain-containing protein, partial [Spirochaetota bacterium]
STPVIALVNGASESLFYAEQYAVITCATAGATIYYTTDGEAPTDKSASLIGSPVVPITGTVTIKAFAVRENMQDSGIASRTVTLKVTAPEITITPGAGSGSFSVAMTCGTDKSAIYYTTGTVYTSYSSSFGSSLGKTVFAKAIRANWAESDVVSKTISGYLYVPYGSSSTAVNCVYICAVGSDGILTSIGSQPLYKADGKTPVVIKECLLDPTKQYLVVSTYSYEPTYDCYLVTYKINYADGSLSFVSAHDACNPSSSFRMVYDSSGDYLWGSFGSTVVRPYVLVDSGDFVDCSTGTFAMQPTALYARPGYASGTANIYAFIGNNIYPLTISCNFNATTGKTASVTTGTAWNPG